MGFNRRIIRCGNRSGAALLIVLFIVMAATILSLGFLSRSDSDLTCGRNMVLRTQMDNMALSGLTHAKGMLLSPQDVATEYWEGDQRQQLVSGSEDYYDVEVLKTSPGNYQVTCLAYRERAGSVIGRSSMNAEVRLDPCIAVRTGSQWTSEPLTTVNGDVYCKGDVLAYDAGATLNGDVFADSDIIATNIMGQSDTYVGVSPVNLPSLTADQFSSYYYIDTSKYLVQAIDTNSLNAETLSASGSNPAGIRYYNGSTLRLEGNVNFEGTLVVNGSVTISGTANTITAVKNFPALIVNGALIIEGSTALQINGLAMITEGIIFTGANADIDITGALFIANQSIAGAYENSANIDVTADADKAAIEIWPSSGNNVRWTPATDAIFRSISR